MKGAAQFFLDTLVEEPKHKWLVTCPSLSPENTHPGGASVCAGPTMDSQIIRDLFTNCIRAAEILGVDADFRAKLAATRARLAPNQIGKAGQLQEWLDDWDMQAPEIHHRHVSHLYGLYPSAQITPRGTPELAAAVRKSLEIRGDDATGWGVGWRINLWARLLDGDHAYRLLTLLMTPPPHAARTCSTVARRSRSTATSAAARASPRCSCRAATARSNCCRRCPRRGPRAASRGSVPAAGLRWTSHGRMARSRPTALPPPSRKVKVRIHGETKIIKSEKL